MTKKSSAIKHRQLLKFSYLNNLSSLKLSYLHTVLVLQVKSERCRREGCRTALQGQWFACTQLFRVVPTGHRHLRALACQYIRLLAAQAFFSNSPQNMKVPTIISIWHHHIITTVHRGVAWWGIQALVELAFFSNPPQSMQGWTSTSYLFRTPDSEKSIICLSITFIL